ncbi:PKD domain-containing protein [Haloarcula amylovorans]|uniref:PKD domain-containing protein n=1 Tax=Haloarcula amylovorans TaxID=2562280 RepID=UPI00142F44E5|nr:PKD domain-containing protein [Halomicroarcula amylolytica]
MSDENAGTCGRRSFLKHVTLGGAAMATTGTATATRTPKAALGGKTASANAQTGPDIVTLPFKRWTESVAPSGDTTAADFYGAASRDDGTVFAVGALDAFSTDGEDGWVVAVGSDGHVQWRETFAESTFDGLYDAQVTDDGGVVVCGHGGGDGSEDAVRNACFARLDGEGTVQARAVYQSKDRTNARAIAPLGDGEYVIAGDVGVESWGDVDYDAIDGWMARVTSDGDVVWEQTLSADGHRSLEGVAVGPDGDIYGVGLSEDDGLLVKMTADGVTEFVKPFGGSEYDELHDVAITGDGVLGLGGYTESFGGYKGWLVVVDRNGDPITSKSFGLADGDGNGETVRALTTTQSGGFVTVGERMTIEESFFSTDYTYHGGVVRSFSAEGTLQWAQRHDADRGSRPMSVTPRGENAYTLAGQYTNTPSGYVSGLEVVDNEVPVPDFSHSPENPGLQEVSFDAAASADGDGEIATYEWDFDGDGTFESSGKSTTYEFTEEGEHRVSLRVTDDRGTTATKEVMIPVENEPPSPAFGTSSSPTAGAPITFYADNVTTDPDGEVARYEWDLDGDGSFETEGATVTATYNESGTRNVTVRAIDDVGAMGTNTSAVDVQSAGLISGSGPLLPGWATVAVPVLSTLGYALYRGERRDE